MKNDSPQNFNCEFAAETIDFVYGEMNDERQSAFQFHLNKCADCAEEIRDFSGIKFSIQDWKTTEFDIIATPKIQIPYEKLNKEIIISTEEISWFDSVKNYFRLSPVLSGAAAFAVLAFLFGLAFFAFRNNDEKSFIAETNIKSNLSPTPIVVKKDSEVNKSTEEKVFVSNTVQSPNKSEEKNIEKQTPVKINNKTDGDQKPQTVKNIERKSPVIESLNNTKDQKAIQTKKKPRLNELPEDEEDNSLRLTDMFAELDTRE